MKSRVLLATILFFTLSRSTWAFSSSLLGCPDPDAIVRALEKLQKSDWQEMSSTRVRSIWPTNLNSLSCEREKGCRLLGSKGRIIEGDCECCEMFDFDLKHDIADSDQLSNIVVHYSAGNRQEVVNVAKKLAKAAGLPEAKAARVGNDPVQKYEWKESRTHVNETFSLELQFSRRARIWQVFLALSRE